MLIELVVITFVSFLCTILLLHKFRQNYGDKLEVYKFLDSSKLKYAEYFAYESPAPIEKEEEIWNYQYGFSPVSISLWRMVEHVMADFIEIWFNSVSSNNDFPNSIRYLIEDAFLKLAHRAGDVNWTAFVLDRVGDLLYLMRIYTISFSELKTKPEFQSKSESDQDKMMGRYLRNNYNFHQGLGEPQEHLRLFSSTLLNHLLKPRDNNCESGFLLLRETFTNVILLPVIGFFDPYWINYFMTVLIKLLPNMSSSISNPLGNALEEKETLSDEENNSGQQPVLTDSPIVPSRSDSSPGDESTTPPSSTQTTPSNRIVTASSQDETKLLFAPKTLVGDLERLPLKPLHGEDLKQLLASTDLSQKIVDGVDVTEDALHSKNPEIGSTNGSTPGNVGVSTEEELGAMPADLPRMDVSNEEKEKEEALGSSAETLLLSKMSAYFRWRDSKVKKQRYQRALLGQQERVEDKFDSQANSTYKERSSYHRRGARRTQSNMSSITQVQSQQTPIPRRHLLPTSSLSHPSLSAEGEPPRQSGSMHPTVDATVEQPTLVHFQADHLEAKSQSSSLFNRIFKLPTQFRQGGKGEESDIESENEDMLRPADGRVIEKEDESTEALVSSSHNFSSPNLTSSNVILSEELGTTPSSNPPLSQLSSTPSGLANSVLDVENMDATFTSPLETVKSDLTDVTVTKDKEEDEEEVEMNILQTDSSEWRLMIVDAFVDFDQRMKPYVVYILQVDNGQKDWVIRKRYRLFEELHSKLKKEIRNFDAVLPKKHWAFTDHLEAKFIKQRKRELARYLTHLTRNKNVMSSQLVREFLTHPADLSTDRLHRKSRTSSAPDPSFKLKSLLSGRNKKSDVEEKNPAGSDGTEPESNKLPTTTAAARDGSDTSEAEDGEYLETLDTPESPVLRNTAQSSASIPVLSASDILPSSTTASASSLSASMPTLPPPSATAPSSSILLGTHASLGGNLLSSYNFNSRSELSVSKEMPPLVSATTPTTPSPRSSFPQSSKSLLTEFGVITYKDTKLSIDPNDSNQNHPQSEAKDKDAQRNPRASVPSTPKPTSRPPSRSSSTPPETEFRPPSRAAETTQTGQSSEVNLDGTEEDHQEVRHQEVSHSGDYRNYRKPVEKKEANVEPLINLVDEIFELTSRGFLATQVMWALKFSFDKVIRKSLNTKVGYYTSEEFVVWAIDLLTETLWPGGKFFTPSPAPTQTERERMKQEAKELLLQAIPNVLQNALTKDMANYGIAKCFRFCQIVPLIQDFGFRLLDSVMLELFPEIRASNSRGGPTTSTFDRRRGRKKDRNRSEQYVLPLNLIHCAEPSGNDFRKRRNK